jgi:hypothetical protein
MARTVFLSSRHEELDADELVRPAHVVGSREELEAAEGDDVFLCMHSFDQSTQAFKGLGNDEAAGEVSGPSSSNSEFEYSAGSTDEMEAAALHVCSDEDDDDEQAEHREPSAEPVARSTAKRVRQRAASEARPRNGRRAQGGNVWRARQSAVKSGILAPPAAGSKAKRASDRPVAAAQRVLTLSARPDVLPCRDTEKQVRHAALSHTLVCRHARCLRGRCVPQSAA